MRAERNSFFKGGTSDPTLNIPSPDGFRSPPPAWHLEHSVTRRLSQLDPGRHTAYSVTRRLVRSCRGRPPTRPTLEGTSSGACSASCTVFPLPTARSLGPAARTIRRRSTCRTSERGPSRGHELPGERGGGRCPRRQRGFELLRDRVECADDAEGLPEALTHGNYHAWSAVGPPETPVIVGWAGSGRGPRLPAFAWLLTTAAEADLSGVDEAVRGYSEHIPAHQRGDRETSRCPPLEATLARLPRLSPRGAQRANADSRRRLAGLGRRPHRSGGTDRGLRGCNTAHLNNTSAAGDVSAGVPRTGAGPPRRTVVEGRSRHCLSSSSPRA